MQAEEGLHAIENRKDT